MLQDLQWNVVEFLKDHDSDEEDNDKEFSVVPSDWLFEQNLEKYTFWPKSKMRKHIKNASEPKKDWETYKVKVLLNEGVSYEEALHCEKENVKKHTETEDENLGTRLGRKRKQVVHDDFTSFSSSDENIRLPPLPKVLIIHSDEVVPEGVTHSCGSADTLSVASGELMPPPQSSVSGTPIQHSNRLLIQSPEQDQIQDVSMLDIEQNANFVYQPIGFQEETNNNLAHLTQKIDYLVRKSTEMKILLDRVINKLNNLPDQNVQEVATSFETIPKQPFKKFSELIEYDNILQESMEAKKQLETTFFLSGGTSPRENISRGLRKIISDKLGKKCSWLGRKNNHQVSNLIMIDILKAATRKNFPSLTEKEFETVVANWLRQANLRHQRNKSRKQ